MEKSYPTSCYCEELCPLCRKVADCQRARSHHGDTFWSKWSKRCSRQPLDLDYSRCLCSSDSQAQWLDPYIYTCRRRHTNISWCAPPNHRVWSARPVACVYLRMLLRDHRSKVTRTNARAVGTALPSACSQTGTTATRWMCGALVVCSTRLPHCGHSSRVGMNWTSWRKFMPVCMQRVWWSA